MGEVRIVGEIFDASAIEPDDNGELPLPIWMRLRCATVGRTSQNSASTVRTGFGANAARGFSRDGASWGLLLEPSGSNLIDEQDLSAFSAVNGATVASATGPDGVSGSFEATDPNGAAVSRLDHSLTPGSVVADHTLSAWHQVMTTDPLQDSRIQYADGVWEPSIVLVSAAGAWSRSDETVPEIASGSLSITPRSGNPGDTGATRWWGLQLEESAYPTSFMADAASLVRAADVLSASPRAVVPGGFLTPTLRYRPHYAHDETSSDHTLIYIDDENRLRFRSIDQRMVLTLGGEDIESDALTFSRHQEIEVEVYHSEDRVRLRVAGATTGNGNTVADGQGPILLPSVVYLMGGASGSEEGSDLTYFWPCQSFFELFACERLLGQDAEAEILQAFMGALLEGRAKLFDLARSMPFLFDVDAGAEGDQLDKVGAIVGLPREGFSDDRYRVFLGIQIELLLSAARSEGGWTGTCSNIIRIARTFIGEGNDVAFRNVPPYSYTLEVEGLDLSEASLLRRFLRIARYGGVLGHLSILLGNGDLWGSSHGAVTGEGIWASAHGAVAGEAEWNTVVTTL